MTPSSSTQALEAARQFNRIVDQVEARCMAVDGPVTPTLQEISEQELSDLWHAVQIIRAALPTEAPSTVTLRDLDAVNEKIDKRFLGPTEAFEPVGVAGTMPGTSGFTMAAFDAAKVPVGTALYASPQDRAAITIPVDVHRAGLAAALTETERWGQDADHWSIVQSAIDAYKRALIGDANAS